MIKIGSTFFRVIPQNFNERRVGMDTLACSRLHFCNQFVQNQSTLSLTSSVRICIEYVCKILYTKNSDSKTNQPRLSYQYLWTVSYDQKHL